MLKRIILIIIAVPAGIICYPQADTTWYRICALQAQYGFIIPHSDAIEPVSHTNPYGFLADYAKLHTSYNSWKVFNACWISGIQAGYYNFQNPGVLGGAIILTGFAEPVLSSGRRHMLTVRAGGGLSYHTEIYDPEDNPSNQFFCTRISFPIYVSLRFKYRISQNLYITLSGYYNHISNGGIKQPNYGMNFPTLSAGVEYFTKPIPLLRKDYKSDLKVKPGIYFILEALTAYKVVDSTEVYPEKGTLSYGLSARMAKQLTPFYSLNAGAEFIADNAIKESIERENLDVDHKRIALTLGQDFHFGQVIFTQYFGFYVYCPYEAKSWVYQKYELGYKVLPNLFLGIFLKAHTYEAELLGFNICLTLSPAP